MANYKEVTLPEWSKAALQASVICTYTTHEVLCDVVDVLPLQACKLLALRHSSVLCNTPKADDVEQ